MQAQDFSLCALTIGSEVSYHNIFSEADLSKNPHRPKLPLPKTPRAQSLTQELDSFSGGRSALSGLRVNHSNRFLPRERSGSPDRPRTCNPGAPGLTTTRSAVSAIRGRGNELFGGAVVASTGGAVSGGWSGLGGIPKTAASVFRRPNYSKDRHLRKSVGKNWKNAAAT